MNISITHQITFKIIKCITCTLLSLLSSEISIGSSNDCDRDALRIAAALSSNITEIPLQFPVIGNSIRLFLVFNSFSEIHCSICFKIKLDKVIKLLEEQCFLSVCYRVKLIFLF